MPEKQKEAEKAIAHEVGFSALLGCPFCIENPNEDPILKRVRNSSIGVDYYFIICEKDHSFTLWSDDGERTIEEYNTRAA